MVCRGSYEEKKRTRASAVVLRAASRIPMSQRCRLASLSTITRFTSAMSSFDARCLSSVRISVTACLLNVGLTPETHARRNGLSDEVTLYKKRLLVQLERVGVALFQASNNLIILLGEDHHKNSHDQHFPLSRLPIQQIAVQPVKLGMSVFSHLTVQTPRLWPFAFFGKSGGGVCPM